MVERTAAVALTAEELDILIDGLDALEYWELGDQLPRNNGEVFIPGDMHRNMIATGDPSPIPPRTHKRPSRRFGDVARSRSAYVPSSQWTTVRIPDSARFHSVIRRKRV